MTYVAALIGEPALTTLPADEEIGIIAPYRAQVRKIRMALSKCAPDVKVASVEEFQGQVSLLYCIGLGEN